MKIIHLETKVHTTFGVLDDLGNVISKQPVSLDLLRLVPESFQEVFQKLDATKSGLQAKIDSAVKQQLPSNPQKSPQKT